MKTVSEREIVDRMRLENPWWVRPHQIDEDRYKMPRREYFELFFPYVEATEPRRALILMGPRRVGKTVMLHQSIQQLIDAGVNPTSICYLDLQTPLYNGIPLEKLLVLAQTASEHQSGPRYYIFFDEVQYLSEWEVHLKTLVDSHTKVKFIASGSAAAALRLKSTESGAGRFTDFLLPPVTFYEYLKLLKWDDHITARSVKGLIKLEWNDKDIDDINTHFFGYLNAGGYPEAIFSPNIRANLGRFIGPEKGDRHRRQHESPLPYRPSTEPVPVFGLTHLQFE